MMMPFIMEEHKHEYIHPIHLRVREKFLDICKKHGNGVWAFEELEWLIYIKHIHEYEQLNDEDKFTLNLFMYSFRSLYK